MEYSSFHGGQDAEYDDTDFVEISKICVQCRMHFSLEQDHLTKFTTATCGMRMDVGECEECCLFGFSKRQNIG